MALLSILRIALYVQLLLGLTRFLGPWTGFVLPRNVWDLHLGLGIVIAALALVALRPLPFAAPAGPRPAARLFPLLPLALGLTFTFNLLPRDPAVVLVHMLLGLATVALVELSAARQRRAVRA